MEMLTAEQKTLLYKAIKNGRDIAIAGQVGSGKSYLFRLPLLLYKFLTSSNRDCTAIDEVVTQDDIDSVNAKINDESLQLPIG